VPEPLSSISNEVYERHLEAFLNEVVLNFARMSWGEQQEFRAMWRQKADRVLRYAVEGP
jgi:hypothetical protein